MLNPLERTFLKNYLRGDKKARLAILISAIGVLLFITVSITLPFKDRLFSMLFPKSASRAADVTAELVNLGNPFNGSIDSGYSKPLFARNVWDMQIFNGKIYLGHGDWGNNTGPTDIWSYDLASKQFVKESSTGTVCGANCVDEEAIEKYRVVDGALVIPGIDDKNSGGSGSFYRQESGSFKKYYNFTSVDHVFDIHSFNSKLFAGVGPRGTSGVKISSDSGVLWQDAVCKGATTCASRTYTLFELAGKLYASIPFLSSSQVTSLMEYDPVANVFNVVPWSSAQNMFVPLSGNALTDTARWITNESTFNSNLVYIVATPGGGNTNNWIPISLVKSSAMGSASQINLPNSATPRDTLVNGSNIYVLAHTGSAGAYTNYVFSSTDLTTWTEVLSFSHETFARSFEYQNGYFYFGMGTDSTALSNKAGDILKAKDPGSTDFTQELVLLGNPTKDRFPNNNDSDEYARNPWD
ncbi:MAG: hypothetical protein Q8Q65_04595, partial [bacterium]|nr:hypothetical protein [bacterium]